MGIKLSGNIKYINNTKNILIDCIIKHTNPITHQYFI